MARLLLLAVAFTLVLPGCFLKPKRKTSSRKNAVPSIVDRQSIFFDRVGDGDIARLQFKTYRPAFCELAYYSQDPTIKPTKDAPTVVPCSAGTQARSEFTEKLEKLRTDALYFVVITAWTDDVPKERGDRVQVQEPGGGGGSGGGTGTPDGKLPGLLVARFDVPLLTAEVHNHRFGEATDIGAIRSKLKRQLGCRAGVPSLDAPFRTAASDVGIKNLVTRDFASGAAGPHPSFPERLKLKYSSLNDGVEKWSLLYQREGNDVQIAARPISRILNMEMSSAETVAFAEAQLAEAVDPLKLDVSRPLKLAWTTGNNLLDDTYLTVQIGRPNEDKAIYCVFAADKRSATIEAKLLQGLDDGRHVILAELSSNQIWAKDGWLVSTYDWRSGRIEK